MKRAKYLKPGDKVHGHGCGWMTVLKVNKCGYNSVKVLYETMYGEKEVIYPPYNDMVEAL